MEISGKINGRLGCENLRKVFTPPSIELGGSQKKTAFYMRFFPEGLYFTMMIVSPSRVKSGTVFGWGLGIRIFTQTLRIPQMKHQVVQQNESPRNITNTIRFPPYPHLAVPKNLHQHFPHLPPASPDWDPHPEAAWDPENLRERMGRCVIVYLSMISEMNGDHQLVWCEKQGIRNDSEVLIDKIRMSLAHGPRVIGYKWL